MVVSMIAAMDKNRLIGNGPDIPWQMPVDRRHFRDMTLRKPVVMGRKTFETLKRPLGKRRNIILTRNRSYEAPKGCIVAHSVEEILKLCAGTEELMICGGAPIYEAFLTPTPTDSILRRSTPPSKAMSIFRRSIWTHGKKSNALRVNLTRKILIPTVFCF